MFSAPHTMRCHTSKKQNNYIHIDERDSRPGGRASVTRAVGRTATPAGFGARDLGGGVVPDRRDGVVLAAGARCQIHAVLRAGTGPCLDYLFFLEGADIVA